MKSDARDAANVLGAADETDVNYVSDDKKHIRGVSGVTGR